MLQIELCLLKLQQQTWRYALFQYRNTIHNSQCGKVGAQYLISGRLIQPQQSSV